MAVRVQRRSRFSRALLAGAACIVFGATLLFAASGAFAATYFSRATANWAVATTWSTAACGGTAAAAYPVAGDTVTICSPHTVTVAAAVPAAAATLTVNSGATLTQSGTLTVSAGSALNIAGTLTSTNTMDIRVPTTITGTLNITSTTGARTFRNPVTISSGGTWNNSANEAVTMRTDLTNNGTFTSGTATYTFSNTGGQWAGSNGLTFAGGVTVSVNWTNNTTMSVAGTLAVSGVVTVTNNATVTASGALTGSVAGSTWTNAANSTLNVGGALLATAGTILNASAAGNTVNYSGAAQTVKLPSGAPAMYYNLSLSGSGTKTMPATAMTISNDLTTSGTISATAAQALTVGRDLTIGGGTTFSGATFTHDVARNFSNSGTFTASTSTVNLNGTVAQAIGGTSTTTFNDLTVSNITAAVSANTNFNTNGTLNMNGANTLLTPAAGVLAGGTGTLTGTGTVQVTRTAAASTFNGQYTITTKTLTNLTVEYVGTAAQQVSNAQTYPLLKINNANGVTLTGGNVTVSTLLTLTSGAVITGANTLITTANCPGSVSRTGGRVAGFLRLQIPTGSPTCTFDVGDSTTYRPVNVAFSSVTAAGNLTGSVSQSAGDHPNISTSGLDDTLSVNRYWTLTNSGVTLTSYAATFNFVAGDVDGGADPLEFEVERWSGAAWNTTTAGTRTSTSTQATGITAFSDYASGKKKGGGAPGDLNAFETSTAAGAIAGNIFTKLVGTNFSLDVVAILTGAQHATFTDTVQADLVTGAAGGLNCPGTPVTIAGTTQNVNLTNGRGTTGSFNVASAFPDVRVRIRYPVASPTVTSCSTNNFSIRPTAFTVSSTNATQTGSSGTPAIKTGANFNLTAASVAGYNGTPAIDNTKVVGTPTAGTIGGSFGAAPVGTGTATGASFFYSEVGNFGLNADAVRDTAFTSVDQGPGDCIASSTSNTLSSGKYGCWVGSTAVAQTTGVSGFGRFIPDNFNVTYTTPPIFGTVCGTFTYVGTQFTFPTAVMTVTARNGTNNGLTNATTTNYAGAYVKLTNASLTPGTQAARYSRFDALGGGTTPALDPAGLPATAGDPAIGTFTNGVGTLTFGSGTGLAFTRSTTTPNAPFNADIALALNVIDTDSVVFAGNPAAFGTATSGGGISFSSGKPMRFGRLAIRNANGSQLVPLPVPLETQYWNGTAFITNTDDSCTPIASANVAMSNFTSNLAACETAISGGGVLSAGRRTLQLAAPGSANNGSVDLTVNLGASASGNTCTAVGAGPGPLATTANLPYLQGNWTGGTYTVNPSARATFGVFKGAEEVIFQRENF